MIEESTCYIYVAKGHLLLFWSFIRGCLVDDMAQILKKIIEKRL